MPEFDESNKTIAKLDFPYRLISTLKHFYEWDGSLVAFGYAGALMVSLPPTSVAPPGKVLMYQMSGTFNQTYVFEGSTFIHMLPLGNDSNKCAALTSRMLTSSENSSKPADPQMYHLFLNNVESAQAILSFEKMTDEDFEKYPKIAIDLYFRHQKDYLKSTYHITFKYYKPGNWLWLWLVLGATALLLISISVLCMVKCWKAIKKENNYSLVEPSPSNNDVFTHDPFINEGIPERLATVGSVSWNK